MILVTPGKTFSLPWYHSKIKDGHRRRRTLHNRAKLRVLILPNISYEELIFNLVVDIDRFIEINEDINFKWIYKVITDIISSSIQEIEESISGLRDTLSIGKYKSGIRLKPGNRGRLQEARFLELDKVYNRDLSVKENLNLVDWIEESVLYSYAKSRGITDHKTKDSEMMSYYNSDLSLRENLRVLKELGYKVSLGKLQGLVKKLE